MILLDDDGDVVEALKDILHAHGVPEVRTAQSVLEAEGMIAAGFYPCVVVLDLLLVHERGEDFLRWLHTAAEGHMIRVVVLSGHEPSLRDLEGTGICLLKPVEPEPLVAAVTSAWTAIRVSTGPATPTL